MTDNINRIPPKELEDKILQLIYLAEINFECCNAINSFFKRQKESSSRIHYNIFLNQDETKYWALSAYNHFCDSISIIHSLLHRTNNKNKELSFQLYEKKAFCVNNFKDKTKTREFLSWTKNLWEEFKEEKFHIIRDKICSHKELKNIGDPSLLALLPIDQKWITSLQEIIIKLKEGAYKFFTEQISNNYLMDIKWGLENILDKIVEVQE